MLVARWPGEAVEVQGRHVRYPCVYTAMEAVWVKSGACGVVTM